MIFDKIRKKILGFIKIFWPFILAGLAIIFQTLVFGIRVGDWGDFYAYAEKYSFFDFIFNRAHGGRIIVDSAVNYIFSHHLTVFLFFTLIATIILLYSLAKILKVREVKFNIFIAIGFIILFPFTGIFASAGPFATITNYLWPSAAFVYGITILTNKNSQTWWDILKVIAIFYASGHEQFGVFAIILFIAFFAKLIFKRARKKEYFDKNFRENIFRIVAFILSIVGMSITFIGNVNLRLHDSSEIKAFFPDFAKITIIKKIDMGFIDTMQHFFINPFFMIIIALILIIVVSIKLRKFTAGTIASAQLLLLTFPQTNEITSKVNGTIAGWNIKNWSQQLSTNGVPETNFLQWKTLIPDVYFMAMILLFCVALWEVIISRKDRIVLFIILFAGFSSRMIMSFSPTIYASNDRTFYPSLLAIFFIILYLVRQQFFPKNAKIDLL